MYANEFAPIDGELKVISVGQGHGDPKSDAFIFTFGSFVLLLDGGLASNYSALQALMDVRNTFMIDRKDLLKDTNIKLKISWIASHWHIDHTGLIGAIASCPYIEIINAYVPASTEYVNFRPKNLAWVNGDWTYRPLFDDVIRKYQARCNVYEVKYGSQKTDIIDIINTDIHKNKFNLRIFPSVYDWGADIERINHLVAMSGKEEGINSPSIPVIVGNANSLWVEACYKDVNMLFTSDTEKHTDTETDPFDLMIKTWTKEIGEVDVVKYPHHGIGRDKAAKAVASFNSRYILITGKDATAQQAMNSLKNSKIIQANYEFIDSSEKDAIFTVNKKGVLSINR